MRILIKNIKELLQVRSSEIDKVSGADMAILPTLKDSWLLLDNDIILDFGSMNDCNVAADVTINAQGKFVLPAWCDSHTHIVYAGNREGEFIDRINNMTYEQIAARGGGILNSAKTLASTSEDDLFNQSEIRLLEVMSLGTGAVEIKSGYGLSVDGELKMLRVIKKLKQKYPGSIKATFLGAHAFPAEYKDDHAGYINLLIKEILPTIVEEGLADYIDAFCESGYFSTAETKQIVEAGKSAGLPAKIHVNQFNSIGGIQLCVENEALSVDHLEVLTDDDISALIGSRTMPVALPSCSYFLSIPYTPARKLMAAGLPVALASDFNPGSSPSGNMNFVVATACIKMRMTPEEAINAATINGAYAMGFSQTHGSITKGKKANIIITKPLNSYYQLPYSFGSNLIEAVFVNGKRV